RVGTGVIYEGVFLELVVALGIFGLLLALLYYFLVAFVALHGLALAVRGGMHRVTIALPLLLSIPWLAYGLGYPILTTRFSAIVSWIVLGICFGGRTVVRHRQAPAAGLSLRKLNSHFRIATR